MDYDPTAIAQVLMVANIRDELLLTKTNSTINEFSCIDLVPSHRIMLLLEVDFFLFSTFSY